MNRVVSLAIPKNSIGVDFGNNLGINDINLFIEIDVYLSLAASFLEHDDYFSATHRPPPPGTHLDHRVFGIHRPLVTQMPCRKFHSRDRLLTGPNLVSGLSFGT